MNLTCETLGDLQQVEPKPAWLQKCLSHLLEHHDQVLSSLEEGLNVDSIYLDFRKAFDKVDIGILCHKMKSLGITGTLAKWIHNFLTNRKQHILVNGTNLLKLRVEFLRGRS